LTRQPHGVRRVRTLIFAMIFGFAFSGYLQRNSVGVAAERMMPELGLTQVQVGWLITAFLLVYAVFQVPGALFGQRYGARLTLALFGLLAVAACVLTAASPLVAAGAAMFAVLLVARSLLGVAQGGLFPVEAGTLRLWYPMASWCSMLGLLVTGLWAGAAATPPLVAWLMKQYGWQAALLITSVPSLLLVGLWYGFARDRPEQHSWVRPAELAELAGNPAYDAAAPLTARRVLSVLANPQILLLTLSYLIMNYVFYLVNFWSFLYLVQERKLSVLESGWLAALPFVVAGVASSTGGRIADALRLRFGERIGPRILPLCTMPLAGLFLYLTVSLTSPYAAVAALCIGFACIELNEGNYWGVAMRLAPNDSMAATALLNTGGNLGGVIGTPIIAALSAAQGGWGAVFLTGAVTSVAAALLWLVVGPARSLRPQSLAA
jgi:ACS family glucarate transporter-like MFS transporter